METIIQDRIINDAAERAVRQKNQKLMMLLAESIMAHQDQVESETKSEDY